MDGALAELWELLVHHVEVEHIGASGLGFEGIKDSSGFLLKSVSQGVQEEIGLNDLYSILNKGLTVLLVQVGIQHS